MTNADRIRDSSDEELAVELTGLIQNAFKFPAVTFMKMTEEQMTAAHLNWLKQEAEE